MSFFTEPKIEERPEQHYIGIRTKVPMSDLPNVIPQLIGEVFAWLGDQGIPPNGAPLMRFHVINMEGMMDMEIGVPVGKPVTGSGHVSAGILPAGRYAALVYTGVTNGIPANAALLDWGAKHGLTWDQWAVPEGDAFGARYETFIDGPDDDPDPAKWKTEVAIKIAE
jgi:effector-binding domain-containing protein